MHAQNYFMNILHVFFSSYDIGQAISQWIGSRATTLPRTLVRVLKLLRHLLIIFQYSRGLDFSTTWRDRYDSSVRTLSSVLHVTHPVMPALLSLWEQQNVKHLVEYSNIR